ncbi:right-handed parallel beta-helix repeat-containing protein [Roseobacter fucihabitans]|uniref:right-handed parallel beta-helix repeat-containing protein n=1 Tax=Roseobacter fucihabitans TaxID=1537242 RepID=UPI0030CF0C6A
MSTYLSDTKFKLKMQRIPSGSMDELALNVLSIDGQSFLEDVVDASSPQLAANPTPGRVTGNGKVVSALIEPLEVGALYLVSYDIIADGGTAGLFFPEGGGSPFPYSTVTGHTLGRHKILVVAEDTDTNAILRVNGDLTFGSISCRKAEWGMNLPAGTAHPELVQNREPGHIRGDGIAISALTSPLETGTAYTLRYEIKGAGSDLRLFTPPDAGAPFPFTRLPTDVGHHAVTLTAQNDATKAVARLVGDAVFGYFSCRKAGGVSGRQIQMDVASGSARSRRTVYTADPLVLYVAPWGDDNSGSGAFGSPFATPKGALAAALPGDTIYLRPGVYSPFAITASGTVSNPITINTLPGEEHLAIIEGDLTPPSGTIDGNSVFGAPEVQSEETRDGIYMRAQDHVHIRNLTIRNVWRAGIFVIGTPGKQHGHHVVADNQIYNTGSSSIAINGQNSDTLLPLAETSDTKMRTDDILIENNDCSASNVITRYNNNITNNQGVPGGVDECISVTSGCSNIITRFNDVHDTRQYGIDYKAGVKGGAIYGNRVWNVKRYGIYLDSGRRYVEDVAIYNNQVWACHLGIVLAREAGSTSVPYDTFTAQQGIGEFVQTLANIDVYNNLVWDTQAAGIYCQRHPQKDGPNGIISNIRIRFNTVYNANRMESGRDLNLSGWSDPEFEAAGVVSDFDFTGNIVWNDTAAVRTINTFDGKPGFSVHSNAIGVDPLFVGPKATPPDLSLSPGSPVSAVVNAAHTSGPFATDISGLARGAAPKAGAYSVTAT